MASARRVHRGPPRLGVWSMIADPLVVESLGRAGADYVGLDLQHGAFDSGSAFRAIQLLDALGIEVHVRIGPDDLALMPRLLDHGASGIIIAMVDDARLVADVVSRTRYQPQGRRSYGGQRYGLRQEPPDLGDVRPMIGAMIETRAGLDAVEEIAMVPGIATVHVGPVDLSLALGLGQDLTGDQVRQAIDSILIAAHGAGRLATMHAVTSTDAAEWLAKGFDELILAADITLLRSALAQELASVRVAQRSRSFDHE